MGATLKGGDKLMRRLGELAKARGVVRAGILEDATTGDGKHIATYAAYNEFGTSGIPARPFLRNTIQREGEKWCRGLERAIANGRSVRDALAAVGDQMVNDIIVTIKSDMPPPNAEATIRAKTKKVDGGAPGETMTPGTLEDTGAMLHAVNRRVEL